MKRIFISQINWIPYEKGGRKNVPPEGTRYCPLIRFLNQQNCEEWSIDFICSNFEKGNIIEFKFLMDHAPYELIQFDLWYDIYEGNKRVAQIRVIDSFNIE